MTEKKTDRQKEKKRERESKREKNRERQTEREKEGEKDRDRQEETKRERGIVTKRKTKRNRERERDKERQRERDASRALFVLPLFYFFSTSIDVIHAGYGEPFRSFEWRDLRRRLSARCCAEGVGAAVEVAYLIARSFPGARKTQPRLKFRVFARARSSRSSS